MTTPQVNDERRLRTVNIIWAVMLATILVYTAVGYFTKGAGTTELSGDEKDTLLFVFAFVAFGTAAASFVVKRAMLLQATQQQSAEKAQAACIVAFSLAESAALFGLITLFVFGSTYSYLMMALGFVCLLLHKPSRDQLAVGPYKNRSWD